MKADLDESSFLRQWYELQAAAALVSGKLSHDFNNYFGAISGALAMLQRKADPGDEKLARRLGMIEKGLLACQEISDEMAGFTEQEERAATTQPFRNVFQSLGDVFYNLGRFEIDVSTLLASDELSAEIKVNTAMFQALAAGMVFSASPINEAALDLESRVFEEGFETSDGQTVRKGKYCVISVKAAEREFAGAELLEKHSLPNFKRPLLSAYARCMDGYLETVSETELCAYLPAR